jgi:hypothetical protein
MRIGSIGAMLSARRILSAIASHLIEIFGKSAIKLEGLLPKEQGRHTPCRIGDTIWHDTG